MYNQIIEQLVEKISTKYCRFNGPLQAPGAPSLTAELGTEALGSLFPAPSAFFDGVGGSAAGIFSWHLDTAALELEPTPFLCLGTRNGWWGFLPQMRPRGLGGSQEQDTPALLSCPAWRCRGWEAATGCQSPQ